ncbi:hypothetical protein P8605_11265, partial [Streptomyces sp. T-3]|nr:hypothetical protein [Streptomyces sp. T-3]
METPGVIETPEKRANRASRSLTPVLRALRGCLHLLMAGLLALAAVRAVADSQQGRATLVVAACAALGIAYGA